MLNDATTKKRSRRGAGSVFQKANSQHWVIQYYRFDSDKGRSVRVREYTKLSSRTAAQKLLTESAQQNWSGGTIRDRATRHRRGTVQRSPHLHRE